MVGDTLSLTLHALAILVVSAGSSQSRVARVEVGHENVFNFQIGQVLKIGYACCPDDYPTPVRTGWGQIVDIGLSDVAFKFVPAREDPGAPTLLLPCPKDTPARGCGYSRRLRRPSLAPFPDSSRTEHQPL